VQEILEGKILKIYKEPEKEKTQSDLSNKTEATHSAAPKEFSFNDIKKLSNINQFIFTKIQNQLSEVQTDRYYQIKITNF
jgi:hypothetical protein